LEDVPVLGNLAEGDAFDDHLEDNSLSGGIRGDVEMRILRVGDEVEVFRNDVLAFIHDDDMKVDVFAVCTPSGLEEV
jgi:hypothetical protein